MRNGTMKKLRNQDGESLAEVLVTILVIALAATMLAMMISATLSMVKTSEKKMNEYYTDSQNLEKLESSDSEDVTVSIKVDGTLIENVSVVYHENKVFKNKPVVAYKVATGS